MRLSVATNFDPALVDALRGYKVEACRRELAAYDDIFRSLDDGAMWRYLPGGSGRGTP